MSMISLPSGHRNDDRRAWGNAPIAAVRGRHIHARFPHSVACPNLPRQRQLGGGKRTDSAVFHSSFAGHSLSREGGLLPLLPRQAATKLRALRGREAGARSAVQAAPGCRHHSFQQLGVNVFEPDFAKLPHVSRLSCVRGPDVDHSTRRHIVNDQFEVGEIRNV